MYRFLNEVGETLRGETITYEITLTTGKEKERCKTSLFCCPFYWTIGNI